MLKRTVSVFIVAWWLTQSATVLALQDQHDRCMAATDGVTVAMLDCLAVAVDEADAALEILQDKLLPSVNSELETKLHVAHEEWAAYRASTCQAEAAAAGSGSFSNGAFIDCHLRITWERLKWLERLSENPDLIDE